MTTVYGIVMGAGKGTRQKALTNPQINVHALPKALLPVGNMTAIDFSLRALLRLGAEKVSVSSHLLTPLLERHLAGLPEYQEVTVYDEPEILDTAGTVVELCEKELQPQADDVICILPCDTPHDIDLGPALAAHLSSPAVATVLVLPILWHHPEWSERSFATVSFEGLPDPKGFKSRTAFEKAVMAEYRHRSEMSFSITGFHEKGPRGTSRSNFINTGIYLFRAGFLDEISGLVTDPQAKRPFSDFGFHFFPFFCGRHQEFSHLLSRAPSIARKIREGSYPFFAYVVPPNSFWMDLASPLRLLKANMRFLDGQLDRACNLQHDTEWHMTSWGWQHRDATVSPKAAPFLRRLLSSPPSQVGKFSAIGPRSKVQSSVVGPYAEVNGSVRRSVVFAGSHHPGAEDSRQDIRLTRIRQNMTVDNCLVTGGDIGLQGFSGRVSNSIVYVTPTGGIAIDPI